jgi:hypothetical protein
MMKLIDALRNTAREPRKYFIANLCKTIASKTNVEEISIILYVKPPCKDVARTVLDEWPRVDTAGGDTDK